MIEPQEHRDHPLYVVNAGGDCIARCDGFAFDNRRKAEIRATARLIAAAPDLLAALQSLIEDREACGIDDSDPDDPLAIILRRARAAVSAATS
jgi:hypothetical protein